MHGRETSWIVGGVLASALALTGCASETAAYHQSRAEDHVYIGPKRSFLQRAARLLAERGQTPQLLSPDRIQTHWVLVSGATSEALHGAEPLVFQSYRVTITSLDDLHHRIRIERGTLTTYESPVRTDAPTATTVQTDPRLPGAQSGLPSLDPPVLSGAPVFAPDGDLEWEFLRRTDPDAAALIEQERPSAERR